MKIIINPKYEAWGKWLNDLPNLFSREGVVIYDARNQIREMSAPDGTRVCVKRYHIPAFPNRVIYSYFRTPKAERAYQNAIRLQQLNISTPETIAYICEQRNGLLTTSYLIAKFSPLQRNFYEFRFHELAGYENIVRDFARFTAHMHQAGVLHKDYSPGNILFDIDKDGKTQFDIVDINRMKFNASIPMRQACKNFARLWGKQDFFELLAEEYAKARNWDIDKCKKLTVYYWKKFWRNRK